MKEDLKRKCNLFVMYIRGLCEDESYDLTDAAFQAALIIEKLCGSDNTEVYCNDIPDNISEMENPFDFDNAEKIIEDFS